jgi:hypothetical protein
MHENIHGLRQTYKAGCRCDLCKQAESEYKKDLRRRQREAVGEFVTPVTPALSLVTPEVVTANSQVSSLGAVEAAVAGEIEQLGPHRRPGVAAVALALARILDNPKAVSTQPPAAGQLVHAMNTLRKSATGAKPKLASVRAMTSKKST